MSRITSLKPKVMLMILICFLPVYSWAGGEAGLNHLTAECVQAAKKFRPIQTDFFYKALHTVEYAGWIGEPNHFELQHPIAMTIRYAGSRKQGYFWFQHSPPEKYDLTVKSDMEGNINLFTQSNDFMNYTFQGIIRNGIIMGLWNNSVQNKAFAFYVYPKSQTDN